MKKLLTLFVIFAILINTAGCSEEWRKKFVRKKKDVAKKPRIYQEKKYTKAPSQELYNKHYNYSITWLSELTCNLGQNNKKDLRCMEEALGQVLDMQNCLVPEKAGELDKHINRLREVLDILKKGDLDQGNKDYVQRTLEREERFLRSEFYYDKIKKFMKESFEDEEDMEPKEIEGA